MSVEGHYWTAADDPALALGMRPIPGLESVLKLFGPISPWRVAIWFESTNAWLADHRPRELLGNEPEKVLRATEHYRNSSHG